MLCHNLQTVKHLQNMKLSFTEKSICRYLKCHTGVTMKFPLQGYNSSAVHQGRQYQQAMHNDPWEYVICRKFVIVSHISTHKI